MSKTIRKVKNFTLDLDNVCSGEIINEKDKMCAIGQYLYKCGYSKDELRNMSSYYNYSNIFNDITGLRADSIFKVNDDTKSSWSRRIKKLTKLFGDVGITLKVKKSW